MRRLVGGAKGGRQEEWAPRSGANYNTDNANNNNSSKKCPPTSGHLQAPAHLGNQSCWPKQMEQDQDHMVREMRANVSLRGPLLSTELADIHLKHPPLLAFNVTDSKVHQSSGSSRSKTNKLTECHLLPVTTAASHCNHQLNRQQGSSLVAGSHQAGKLASSSKSIVTHTKVEERESVRRESGECLPATSVNYLNAKKLAATSACYFTEASREASSMRRRRSSHRNKPENTSIVTHPPQDRERSEKISVQRLGRPRLRLGGYSHAGSMCPSWRQLALFMFVSVVVTSILASLSATNNLPASACFFASKHCHALATEPAPQSPLLQPEVGVTNEGITQMVASNESMNQQVARFDQTPQRSTHIGLPEVTASSNGYLAGSQVSEPLHQEHQFIQVSLGGDSKMSTSTAQQHGQQEHHQEPQIINHRTDYASNSSAPSSSGPPHNHQPSTGKLSFNELPEEQQRQEHHFSSQAAHLDSLYSSSRLEPLSRAADTKPKSEASFVAPPQAAPEMMARHQQAAAAKQSKFVPLVPIAQAASSSSNAIKVIAAPLFTDPQRDWGGRATKKPANTTLSSSPKKHQNVGPTEFQQVAAHSANSAVSTSSKPQKNVVTSSSPRVNQPAQVPNQLNSHTLLNSPIVAEPPLDTSFILTNNIPELNQLKYLNELLASNSLEQQPQLVGLHQHTIMSPGHMSPFYHQYNMNQATTSGGQLTSGRAQSSLRQPLRPLVSVSSASAPSVSLPPLTHLLVPRNPFRLFSSSSSPLATRYRPSFLATRDHLKQQSSRSKVRQPSQYSAAAQSASYGWPAFQHQLDASASVAKAFRGHPSHQHESSQLYAHAHSVQQLEQLIRAASQIDGVRSPILPAIVSASTGQTFPGLYIPAIESDSESQTQEIRQHGDERLPLGATNSMAVAYKIPGTDYILHPEEVKAMMSIGENAWRQSSQNQATITPNEHLSSSGSSSSQIRDPQQVRSPVQVSVSTGRLIDGWRKKNYLKENHAQNLRDFAYVDPPVVTPVATRDQLSVPSSNSMLQLQQHRSNYPMNVSQYMLGPMLSQQVRFSSFPPFIRLHNQDYVRWQLINGIPSMAANKPILSNTAPSQQAHIYWGPEPPPMGSGSPVPYRQSAMSNGFRMQTSPSSTSGAQQVPVLLASSSATGTSTSGPSIDITNENSPIRLATQLTPSEISQVEDSILEALLVSQQLERQQNMMRLAADTINPFFLRPISVQLAPLVPQQPQVKSPQDSKTSQKRVRKGGLFKRRRERKSSPEVATAAARKKTNKSKKQSPMMEQQLEPLTNETVTLALASLYTPTRVEFMAAPVLGPLITQSKLNRNFRIPVLMAEQDTNKPTSWSSHSEADDETPTGSATTSKLRKRFMIQADDLLQSPSHQVRHMVSAKRDNCDGEMGSFGSRVGATTCKHPPGVNKLQKEGRVQKNRHLSAAGLPERGNYLEGMPSDADYFPGSTANALHHSHQQHPSMSLDHPRHPESAQQLGSTQQTSSSRLSLATEIGHRGRHFLPSQLKLQFSQDYQAREGVPIYNNNVRAAGALDRPRAVLALADSSRRPSSQPGSWKPVHRHPSNKPPASPVPMSREPAASEDDEMHEESEDQDKSSAADKPDEDLWLKGSSPTGSKASQPIIHSPKTLPKKPTT